MAAVDMFVVATATFRLLYAVIVLGHERRNIIHFDVTGHPTQVWLAHQMTEAFPWDTAPRYLLRDRDASYGAAFRDRVRVMVSLLNTLKAKNFWSFSAFRVSSRDRLTDFSTTAKSQLMHPYDQIPRL
jgi:hypothetical protein